VLAVAFMGGVAVQLLLLVDVDRRDPIQEWVKLEAVNSPIRQGSVLIVNVERIKVRDDCAVISVRRAQDEDGKSHDLPDVIWEGGSSEEGNLLLPYGTQSLMLGSYLLQVELEYLCPGGLSFVHHPPDVRFRVVE